MGNLFQELKRRKVFRVAAVYAVVAWVLIQVADTVLPALQMPQWTVSFVTVLFILGFPIAVILAWAYEATPEGIKPETDSQSTVLSSPPTNQYLIYATFMLVLVVAIFQVADRFFTAGGAIFGSEQATQRADFGVVRSKISLGEIDQLLPNIDIDNFSAISPDGKMIASAVLVDGVAQLRLRRVDEFQFRILMDSTTSEFYFIKFSPDNQQILVDTSDGLQVIGVDGTSLRSVGREVTLGSGATRGSFAWLDNERVIFRNSLDRMLYTVSLRNGQAKPLSIIGNARYDFKQLAGLPVSNLILATVDANLDPNIAENSISIVNLETGTQTPLIDNAFASLYLSSGHIAFVREQELWVVPFDVESGEITGAEYPANIPLLTASQEIGTAIYAVSNNGLLIFPEQTIEPTPRELVWVDLDGNRNRLQLPPGRYSDPILSPSGDRLAVTIYEQNGGSDIWMLSLRQNTLSRVTFSGDAFNIVWSPDGEHLYYERSESPGIWRSRPNGIGDPQRILASNTRTIPNSVTPDGTALIYMSGFGNAYDFSEVSLVDENNTNRVLLASGFNEVAAAISPDGKWLAYTNNEAGDHQVYLRPYPNVDDNKWQISTAGGWEPSWSPDGDKIYFASYSNDEDTGTRGIYSVSLTFGTTLEIGSPVRIATGFSVNGNDYPNYDVHPDERQIIGFEEDRTANQTREEFLILVSNWFEELRRLAPTELN